MNPKAVSVIIPTYNEAGNIQELITRIDRSLSIKGINYELIFIDDYSSDTTRNEIKKHGKDLPVRLFLKRGARGKAYSLLEGFSYAKYSLVAMIDGDLQYPPEAISHMLDEIDSGSDIVVANRDERQLGAARRMFSQGFRLFFGKILHNLDVDVQSGLKVFRREILERIRLEPSPWTFDLEFLLQALNAGYSVGSVEIEFYPRVNGKSKVNILKTSLEIGWSAVKAKFKPFQPVPLPQSSQKRLGKGFDYQGKRYVFFSDLSTEDSAVFSLTSQQKENLIAATLLVGLALVAQWHTTIVILLAIATLFYFADLLFNAFIIQRSFATYPEIKLEPSEMSNLDEENLPTYTILCPLYKEWEVLPQFVKAIQALDYPKDKLQVLLLLEKNDQETIRKAREFNLPKYFEISVVPQTLPKTKPKACNWGLLQAKGEYTVIYDAEDVPEPDQLKKVIAAFSKVPKNVTCIQAKLNFYNTKQNLLTRLFTAEYSLWFDLILTGLQSVNAPIPLGGTSNHFKTNDLKSLHGWDAFNVTEDCDLGLRIVKRGYQTAIVDSVTHEEANSDVVNWFNQRTRWIKGYIQTYLVHSRKLTSFWENNRKITPLTFSLVVGGKVFAMLVNPVMWLISAAYFIFRPLVGETIESFFPSTVYYLGVTAMFVGNFIYFYTYMVGLAKRKQFDLIKYAFLVPLYWLAMSAAAWTALYRLVKQPHYWFKTKHGLHLRPQPKAAGYSQADWKSTQVATAKARE